jgi:hypothetical protein
MKGAAERDRSPHAIGAPSSHCALRPSTAVSGLHHDSFNANLLNSLSVLPSSVELYTLRSFFVHFSHSEFPHPPRSSTFDHSSQRDDPGSTLRRRASLLQPRFIGPRLRVSHNPSPLSAITPPKHISHIRATHRFVGTALTCTVTVLLGYKRGIIRVKAAEILCSSPQPPSIAGRSCHKL